MATPTGLEAKLPTGVTSVALVSAAIRWTHSSESGTHTWTSVGLPASSVSVSLYESCAVTSTSTQRPSEVRPMSRARSAAARRAGAMSGEAATFRSTASS
ncbi:hypothetical protein QF037_007781 [Streptomyces canus]|nr:hypothetical protein [Streptomyces canus]